MAELGSYQIPKEFKDEDKWFRFFTKKQLIVVGAALAACVVIVSFFYGIGMLKVGLAIAEIIMVLAVAVVFIRIPTDRYLIGGGYHIAQIVGRLIIKRLPGHKIIYVKNYEEGQF